MIFADGKRGVEHGRRVGRRGRAIDEGEREKEEADFMVGG